MGIETGIIAWGIITTIFISVGTWYFSDFNTNTTKRIKKIIIGETRETDWGTEWRP